MDLLKLRRLAGIAVTPAHFKQQKELREARLATRDYDRDKHLETSTQEYLGSRDRAIKRALARRGEEEQEMSFNISDEAQPTDTEPTDTEPTDTEQPTEPEDESTAQNIDPNDPEVQALLGKLRGMSDEEVLAYVRDLLSQTYDELGETPPEQSVLRTAVQNKPVVREDHFKKGQMIKDKKGNDWKVVSYTGTGEKKDDEVYTLRCPKTGTVVKKKVTELHEGTNDYGDNYPFPLSHTDSSPKRGIVNIAQNSGGDQISPSETKDESPDEYAHVDQGPHSRDEVTEKVTVPQNIKSALNSTITELRQVAEKVEKRDPAQSWFNNMAADAMQEILNNLNLGTVTGIKEAQINTTKLMGPILQRIPDEVFNFLARGGQHRSLKDYFYEVKGYPIEGPINTIQ